VFALPAISTFTDLLAALKTSLPKNDTPKITINGCKYTISHELIEKISESLELNEALISKRLCGKLSEENLSKKQLLRK